MKKTFNYFDKSFVISAKDNIERRKYMRDILSNLDINYEFFDAVIGNNLSEKEIDKVYDEEKAKKHKTIKRSLRKSEIGCALSHLNIYKQIIEQDLNNALIFEDDIKPVYDNIDNYVDNALKELPPDWDLFLLGTLNHYETASFSYKLKLISYYPFIKTFFPVKNEYRYQELWNIYPKKFSKSLKRAGYFMGCHAYGISRAGAQKILNYSDDIFTPMDCLLSLMVIEGHFRGFMTKKNMFDQNKEFESSIQPYKKDLSIT